MGSHRFADRRTTEGSGRCPILVGTGVPLATVDRHYASPGTLLTQNSELRKSNIYNWTLPAFLVTLSDGTRFNCCPNAGPCARVCYARFGTYIFRNVKERHLHNLEFLLLHPDAWQQQMLDETATLEPTGIPHRLEYDRNDWLDGWVRHGGQAVRIHDAGDFYSLDYFLRWAEIARQRPRILFYAYTKEVAMIQPLVPKLTPNFRIIFSYGGLQDDLIDRDRDRNADVFPDLDTLLKADYTDQEENDVLAAIMPNNKVGIVRNNIPVAIKRFDGRPMSDLRPNRQT